MKCLYEPGELERLNTFCGGRTLARIRESGDDLILEFAEGSHVRLSTLGGIEIEEMRLGVPTSLAECATPPPPRDDREAMEATRNRAIASAVTDEAPPPWLSVVSVMHPKRGGDTAWYVWVISGASAGDYDKEMRRLASDYAYAGWYEEFVVRLDGEWSDMVKPLV